MFAESDVHDVLGLIPEEFQHEEISDAVIAAFRAGRCLGPDDRKASLDGFAGVVCLPFEMTSESADKELGHLQRLLERPFGLEPRFALADTQEKYGEICKILL